MLGLGIIGETDSFSISVNSLRWRTYWAVKQTWQENRSELTMLEAMLQECSRSFPSEGTVVLDTAALRIMRPQTASQFLLLFHAFLHEHKVQALAHVCDPHNVMLKMQFQRVLRELDRTDELLHKSFSKTEEAESWLDTMIMPRSQKRIPQKFPAFRAVSAVN